MESSTPTGGSHGFNNSALDVYFDDLDEYELLTKADEFRLGSSVQAGLAASEFVQVMARETTHPTGKPVRPLDEMEVQYLQAVIDEGQRAKDEMVQANLRLVISIAKRCSNNSGILSLEDIIQEGNMGLMHAVDMFKPQKGFKFSTYASWWIRQAVGRALDNMGSTIRIPVHALDELKILTAAETGIWEQNREATDEELTDITGFDADKLGLLHSVRANRSIDSLDKAFGEDDDLTSHDLIEDRSAREAFASAEGGVQVLIQNAYLSDREELVLALHWGLLGDEPLSFTKIGKEFGCTSENIRKIERRALNKIRELINRHPEELGHAYGHDPTTMPVVLPPKSYDRALEGGK